MSNKPSAQGGAAMGRSRKIADETRAVKEKLAGTPASLEDVMNDNYRMLGNAIILQGVNDYRIALEARKSFPDNAMVNKRCKEVEDFFFSDWFATLTDIDPEALVKKLRKEANECEYLSALGARNHNLA